MRYSGSAKTKVLFKVIPIHLLIWGGLFFINFIFLNNYRIEFDVKYHIFLWLIYISLFYINYLILMPGLFFRKRFILYTVFSITILAGTYYVKMSLERKQFERIILNERRIPNPDKPHFYNKMPPPPMIHEDRPFPSGQDKRPRRFGIFRFSFYSILLIFLASISIRFIQKWQDDEKQNVEMDKERISNELLFLKQQVNPHFLFNALNSIYSMTIKKSKPASDTILKLSSILRYMLYETENKMVNLRDELFIISDYIDLQRLRLPENVKLNYSLKGEVENQKIAPLLLIPLIENAFKFGTDNIGESFIDIMLEISENKLNLINS